MFDSNRFSEEFAKTGMKKRFVSDKLGMSYDHFLKLTTGTLSWRTDEVVMICQLLHWNKRMRDAIFFANEVDNLSTVKEA